MVRGFPAKKGERLRGMRGANYSALLVFLLVWIGAGLWIRRSDAMLSLAILLGAALAGAALWVLYENWRDFSMWWVTVCVALSAVVATATVWHEQHDIALLHQRHANYWNFLNGLDRFGDSEEDAYLADLARDLRHLKGFSLVFQEAVVEIEIRKGLRHRDTLSHLFFHGTRVADDRDLDEDLETLRERAREESHRIWNSALASFLDACAAGPGNDPWLRRVQLQLLGARMILEQHSKADDAEEATRAFRKAVEMLGNCRAGKLED